MGKGTVLSEEGNGRYSIAVNYYRDRYEAAISTLDKNITELWSKIIGEIPAGTIEYEIANLQHAALLKRKSFLQSRFPDDKIISVWCADLTTGLSGEIATVEVPGESSDIQIAPGFNGGASYSQSKDGQLEPAVSQTPAQWFYNLAMLPGWQKWKPTFRYGVITSLSGNVCGLSLEPAISSQQGLNVNQSETLSGVAISYMDCDGSAFAVGDAVLIKFEGQDWSKPKVVGFKESPKSCGGPWLFVSAGNSCVVWDLGEEELARDVFDNDGELVDTFPVESDSISNWLGPKSSFSGSNFLHIRDQPRGPRTTCLWDENQTQNGYWNVDLVCNRTVIGYSPDAYEGLNEGAITAEGYGYIDKRWGTSQWVNDAITTMSYEFRINEGYLFAQAFGGSDTRWYDRQDSSSRYVECVVGGETLRKGLTTSVDEVHTHHLVEKRMDYHGSNYYHLDVKRKLTYKLNSPFRGSDPYALDAVCTLNRQYDNNYDIVDVVNTAEYCRPVRYVRGVKGDETSPWIFVGMLYGFDKKSEDLRTGITSLERNDDKHMDAYIQQVDYEDINSTDPFKLEKNDDLSDAMYALVNSEIVGEFSVSMIK